MMTARETLYLILAVLAAGGYKIVRVLWFPLTSCRRCRGDGKHRDWTRRHWRLCKRCRGSGTSVRFGRVVLDKVRTARTKARKAA